MSVWVPPIPKPPPVTKSPDGQTTLTLFGSSEAISVLVALDVLVLCSLVLALAFAAFAELWAAFAELCAESAVVWAAFAEPWAAFAELWAEFAALSAVSAVACALFAFLSALATDAALLATGFDGPPSAGTTRVVARTTLRPRTRYRLFICEPPGGSRIGSI